MALFLSSSWDIVIIITIIIITYTNYLILHHAYLLCQEN